MGKEALAMSRYFENELIEQIKDANDIVSVVSEHVALKKRGKNYWGCCPFHNEKTPSFSVAPEKGFYYCFGCHASGNAIKFLMELEHLTFVEALNLVLLLMVGISYIVPFMSVALMIPFF